MDEKQLNARLAIYTPEFLIHGYVKLTPMKIMDKEMFPRRISDIILSASERMAQVGESDFLEINNADIKDLRTNQLLEGIKCLAVSKSSIEIIYQMDT